MQQISENVFVETGYRGANVGMVVTEEGLVLIDTPQQPSDAVAWRELVLSRGVPLYIVHTEVHADHILGDFFFPEARIITHEGMRGRLPVTPEAVKAIRERLATIDPDGVYRLDDYVARTPTITFSDHMHLYLGEQSFELVNLPGHTAEQPAAQRPGRVILAAQGEGCDGHRIRSPQKGSGAATERCVLFHSKAHANEPAGGGMRIACEGSRP